jgi:hypothetical protein
MLELQKSQRKLAYHSGQSTQPMIRVKHRQFMPQAMPEKKRNGIALLHIQPYMLSNNTIDVDYLNNSIINIINGIYFIIHFIFIGFEIMVQDTLKNNFPLENILNFYFIFNISKLKP